MTGAEQADESALATYLRECRVAMGSPSIREMARQAKVSRGAVHNILTGQSVPRRNNLNRLVAYLGADPDKAYQLAAQSKSVRYEPKLPRVTLRHLSCEVAALRDAITELTDTVRQQR